jgi:hypothetical protein
MNLPGETFCQKCGVVLGPVSGQPPPLPRALSSSEQPPAVNHPNQEARPATPAREPSTGKSPASTPAPVHGVFRLRDSARLLAIPPGRTQVLIGRADIAEGFFPDIDLEPLGGEQKGVSRRHALLTAQSDQVMITDLNSTNFTFINHQVLTAGQAMPLKNGDIVQIGQLVLIFEDAA